MERAYPEAYIIEGNKPTHNVTQSPVSRANANIGSRNPLVEIANHSFAPATQRMGTEGPLHPYVRYGQRILNITLLAPQ